MKRISTSNFLMVLVVLAITITLMLPKVSTSQIPIPSPAFPYTHINTNTTTQVATGRGILHTVAINTSGASSNTVTIYDGTSVTTGTVIGVLNGTMAPGYQQYDLQFNVGLLMFTSNGTAADLTATWRNF